MGGRYLVLSDVHRREWVPGAAGELIKEHSLDAVVLLGDITHFGPPQFAEEFIRELSVKCYAVPGNCDPLGTEACIKSVGTSLHGVKMRIDGRTWGGLGGSNPSIFRTPFEMPEKEIARRLEPIMEEGMVLTLPPTAPSIPPSPGSTWAAPRWPRRSVEANLRWSCPAISTRIAALSSRTGSGTSTPEQPRTAMPG